jgi:DNA-binding response OmpR family regulator
MTGREPLGSGGLIISTSYLVVEDDSMDFDRLERQVDGSTMLHRAESVEEARLIMASINFDGVLLDLGLDDTRGLSGVIALRPLTLSPLIVWTGTQDEDDKQALEAIKAGADYWIEKGTPWSAIRRAMRIEGFKREALRKLGAHEPR